MIEGSALFGLLVKLAIAGLIFFVAMWGLKSSRIPEPFNTVIRVVLILVAVIFLIGLLMGLGGHPLIR